MVQMNRCRADTGKPGIIRQVTNRGGIRAQVNRQAGSTAGWRTAIADGQSTQAEMSDAVENLENPITRHAAIAIHNGLIRLTSRRSVCSNL